MNIHSLNAIILVWSYILLTRRYRIVCIISTFNFSMRLFNFFIFTNKKVVPTILVTRKTIPPTRWWRKCFYSWRLRKWLRASFVKMLNTTYTNNFSFRVLVVSARAKQWVWDEENQSEKIMWKIVWWWQRQRQWLWDLYV